MGTFFDLGRQRTQPVCGPPRYLAEPLLGITVHHPAHGVCVIAVDGELDMLTTPQLQACVSDQLTTGPAHLIIDLERVRFLGVSGLSALLQARELASQTTGSYLHLAGLVTRCVARQLEITGLRGYFDAHATLTQALASLAQSTSELPTPPRSHPVADEPVTDGRSAHDAPASSVFSAWWCGSVGTTWTLELRRLDHATPIRPAEWICSGVPINQPIPTSLAARLLAQRDLLLYPDSAQPRTPRTLNRQLIGYATRDPEVITLAKALPQHTTRHEHPMIRLARWIHAGYTSHDAAHKIIAGMVSPGEHDISPAH